jgi:hypothetical protein
MLGYTRWDGFHWPLAGLETNGTSGTNELTRRITAPIDTSVRLARFLQDYDCPLTLCFSRSPAMYHSANPPSTFPARTAGLHVLLKVNRIVVGAVANCEAAGLDGHFGNTAALGISLYLGEVWRSMRSQAVVVGV